MKVKHVLMIAAVLLAMLIMPAAADEAYVVATAPAKYTITIPTSVIDVSGGSATGEAKITVTTPAPGSTIALSVVSSNGFNLVHTYASENKLSYTMTAGNTNVPVDGGVILEANAASEGDAVVVLSFASTEEITVAGTYRDTLTFTADEIVAVNDGSELKAAAASGSVKLEGYVEATATFTAPISDYKTGVKLAQGATLDGNGQTLSITPTDTEKTLAVLTSGGTIKDLTITDGRRGIYMDQVKEDVVLEDVTISGPGIGYTINTNSGFAPGVKLIATGCTFDGWTTYSQFASATFTNCNFGMGQDYFLAEYPSNPEFNGCVRPYVDTVFENCEFDSAFTISLTGLGTSTITFKACTVGGVPLTGTAGITWQCPGGKTVADFAGQLNFE